MKIIELAGSTTSLYRMKQDESLVHGNLQMVHLKLGYTISLPINKLSKILFPAGGVAQVVRTPA
jgi:hypothetical protein